MTKRLLRCAFTASIGVAMLVSHTTARAQNQAPAGVQALPTEVGQTRFNSGQNVVPVYEGWIRNADGTFDMVFGYFNRNYREELSIPAGPDNTVEPGGPDRGQPTYFLPRRQSRLFRVRVPRDWGKKELVWTIRVNGKVEKAYGELLPVQEINEHIMMTGNNSVNSADDDNQPPAITVPAVSATVGSAVALTATVVDDGLPKPRALVTPAPRPATPTTGTTPPSGGTTGADGTLLRQRNSNATPVRPRGLTVSWFQYGGPAKVTFTPSGQIPVANGSAATSARFEAPGTYVLQASANDGALTKRMLVTVVVK